MSAKYFNILCIRYVTKLYVNKVGFNISRAKNVDFIHDAGNITSKTISFIPDHITFLYDQGLNQRFKFINNIWNLGYVVRKFDVL